MTEKWTLDLSLVLPDIPDERDACVGRWPDRFVAAKVGKGRIDDRCNGRPHPGVLGNRCGFAWTERRGSGTSGGGPIPSEAADAPNLVG